MKINANEISLLCHAAQIPAMVLAKGVAAKRALFFDSRISVALVFSGCNSIEAAVNKLWRVGKVISIAQS